jgi:predicted TIM-barrel fold metal-dependent hydrolase
VVSVEFMTDAGGTRVVLEHSGLASEESRVRHNADWNATLASLARRVFDEGVPRTSSGG